jgi:hypothetical protein
MDYHTEMVKVSPTWKPQSLNAMRRLERVLSRNLLTRGQWRKESGYIYPAGELAHLLFIRLARSQYCGRHGQCAVGGG